MAGRIIIVGDIHGCLAELRSLLDEVAFSRDDALVSVGDLVGKGPDGAGVVRFFLAGGHRAVRGNHDEKLLAYRRDGRGTLSESHRAHAEALRERDWEWLSLLPLWIRLREHDALVVHAGLVPGVRLKRQEPKVLMNLRSIRPDGAPSRKIEGTPWAKLWPGPELVVFGHDAVRGLQRWPHAVGLDTGCVYGGALSALVLPERAVVSVPAFDVYSRPVVEVDA